MSRQQNVNKMQYLYNFHTLFPHIKNTIYTGTWPAYKYWGGTLNANEVSDTSVACKARGAPENF